MIDKRATRMRQAGYDPPSGILERIEFTLAENSFQNDDQTHLLQDLLQTLNLTNTLLQDILQKSILAEKPLSSRPADKWTSQKTVVIEGKTYDSPKLFEAIAWLEANPAKRDLPVRQIADLIGISKSWIAIAKKHSPISSEAK